MQIDNPLVSVIVPVYNGDHYLGEAIESILAQTYRPIEIIVIDDGSTDSSAAVAESFGSLVQYYHQINQGSSAARNYGISLAQGSFFSFLDADDLWVEDKITRQVAALRKNHKLDIVFGQVQQFYSPELDDSVKGQIHCPTEPMVGHIPSALLIKRDAFFRVGLFDTHIKSTEYVDWHVRATDLGLQMMVLPNVVAKRRLHKTNKGVRDRQLQRTEYSKILKASLDRRRASGKLG